MSWLWLVLTEHPSCLCLVGYCVNKLPCTPSCLVRHVLVGLSFGMYSLSLREFAVDNHHNHPLASVVLYIWGEPRCVT